MKAKKQMTDMMSKLTKSMAVMACGTASMLGTYQPKEPQALKNLKK